MADSAQARFTTFEIPGLMMTPIPHSGVMTNADRSQLNDIYAGIDAHISMIRSETCWVPLSGKPTTWTSSKSVSSPWKKAGSNTSTWKNEKEVTPCQD